MAVCRGKSAVCFWNIPLATTGGTTIVPLVLKSDGTKNNVGSTQFESQLVLSCDPPLISL